MGKEAWQEHIAHFVRTSISKVLTFRRVVGPVDA